MKLILFVRLFYFYFLLIISSIFGESCSGQCTKYGNDPALSSRLLINFNKMIEVCQNISGQLLTYQDNNNEERCACLLVTSSSKTLPLVVWLQPSVSYATSIFSTNFTVEALTIELLNRNNNSSGYHLLLPAARITKNCECRHIPCVTWDIWFRNFNRSDPQMNVDIKTIDYFIDHIINHMSNIHVDSSKIFLSGWSNGASMALLYALNTPNIASAAVYSSQNPYKNENDPCPQTPFLSECTSILILVNSCDSPGICQGAQEFITDLNIRYDNQIIAEFITINGSLNPKPTLISKCCLNCSNTQGLINHSRWPIHLNEQIFYSFFRKNQLK